MDTAMCSKPNTSPYVKGTKHWCCCSVSSYGCCWCITGTIASFDSVLNFLRNSRNRFSSEPVPLLNPITVITKANKKKGGMYDT